MHLAKKFLEHLKLLPNHLHDWSKAFDIRVLIPKFHATGHTTECQSTCSWNLLPWCTNRDREEIERFWSVHNSAGKTMKEMAPGNQADILDAFFGASNWQKYLKLGMVFSFYYYHTNTNSLYFQGLYSRSCSWKHYMSIPYMHQHSLGLQTVSCQSRLLSGPIVWRPGRRILTISQTHIPFKVIVHIIIIILETSMSLLTWNRYLKHTGPPGVGCWRGKGASGRDFGTEWRYTFTSQVHCCRLGLRTVYVSASFIKCTIIHHLFNSPIRAHLATDIKNSPPNTLIQEEKIVNRWLAIRHALEQWHLTQMHYMPGIWVHIDRQSSSKKVDSANAVELMTLWLPLALPLAIRRQICPPQFCNFEWCLHQAAAYEALEELHQALCLTAQLFGFRHHQTLIQWEGTCANRLKQATN